ncbi:MAG: class I SAM-dependent methyltransferase [Bacillota bacterium]
MDLPTKEIIIVLAGRELYLEVIRDLEELVDDPTDEDQIPCWAEIWPAARAMASYIWEHLDLRGKKVLELGAGMGLPGMVAGLKGARVTLSDYQPLALEQAALNVKNNGIPGVEFLLADWRKFPLGPGYDWVLASDILYDPKFFSHLISIIQTRLVTGGHLLASHPGRQDTFKFLLQLGRSVPVEEMETTMPVEIDDPYFPHYLIHIHDITRK